MSRLKIGWLVGLLWMLALTAQGQTNATGEATAARYLTAVEQLDWDTMQRLLTPDAVFEDPTAETFDQTWRFEGADNIVAFYRSETENADTLGTEYRIVRQFTSGERTVFELEIDVTVRAGMIGFPEKIIEDTMQVVTVIRVVDGRVTHHTDYVDYAGMFERLEAHRQRLESESSQ